jgi:hypothetical protein
MDKILDAVLDAVIDYLGDYDSEQCHITLYGVPNEKRIIDELKRKINAITTKYKFIILDPKEDYTNIKILDVNL